MFTTYTHYRTGEQFTATGEGEFGAASLAGTWADGTEGVIWPAETLNTGRLVWGPA